MQVKNRLAQQLLVYSNQYQIVSKSVEKFGISRAEMVSAKEDRHDPAIKYSRLKTVQITHITCEWQVSSVVDKIINFNITKTTAISQPIVTYYIVYIWLYSNSSGNTTAGARPYTGLIDSNHYHLLT
jgi:hypothetical protein